MRIRWLVVACVVACSKGEAPPDDLPKWKGPPATDYDLVADRIEDLGLGPELIDDWAGGGMTGQMTAQVRIYSDGTVVFAGENCKGVKGRRHHLRSDDVKRLGHAIDATGVLGKKPRCEPGPDGLGEQITLAQRRSYSRDRGCQDPTPIFDMVHDAVGPNPCSN